MTSAASVVAMASLFAAMVAREPTTLRTTHLSSIPMKIRLGSAGIAWSSVTLALSASIQVHLVLS